MMSHLNHEAALKVAYYQKFQNDEAVKGGCIPRKNKLETKNTIKVAR